MEIQLPELKIMFVYLLETGLSINPFYLWLAFHPRLSSWNAPPTPRPRLRLGQERGQMRDPSPPQLSALNIFSEALSVVQSSVVYF